MIGHFTATDVTADIILAGMNVVLYLLIAVTAVGIIRISRKAGERIRNSVVFVFLSVVFASFFKSAVIEALPKILTELTFVSYAYLLSFKRYLSQLLYIVAYAARRACPYIMRTAASLRQKANGYFKGYKGVCRTLGGSSVLKSAALRPSFHFIS